VPSPPKRVVSEAAGSSLAPSAERLLMVAIFILSGIPILLSDKQSFWIDEGVTIAVSRLRTLAEIGQYFLENRTSEPQLPGYFIYTHLWVSVFGDSELAARLSNWPWVGVFSYFWIKISGLLALTKRERILFALTAPILPFYVNFSMEFRPYVALIALGSMAYYGFLLRERSELQSTRLISWALCLSVFLSMLGLFFMPAILATEALKSRLKVKDIVRKYRNTAAYVIPFLALMTAYYIATVFRAAGGMRFYPTPVNAASIFYEFFGMIGIGPTRESFHSKDIVGVFLPFVLPLTGLGMGILILLLSGFSSRDKWAELKGNVGLNLSFFGILFLLIIAYAGKWQVLARHSAMLFAAFIAPLVRLVCVSIFNGRSQLTRASALVILGLWGYSTHNLIFNPRYFRDDYRGVISFLGTVDPEADNSLFSGDVLTTRFYWARFFPASDSHDLRFSNHLDKEGVARMVADLKGHNAYIVRHKPKYYDELGGLADWMANQTNLRLYKTFNSFEVWILTKP
jgi:hypothetical protein